MSRIVDGPNQFESWRASKGKVRYGSAQVDDPENIGAFIDHTEAYGSGGPRKPRRRKGIKPTPKNEPYCRLARWMISAAKDSRDDCLFLPGSHPGFRAQVRFNFRRIHASRAMCIIAHGTPPFDGAMALHKCGNGHLSCVNPAHLRWGTASENANDDALHYGEAESSAASIEAAKMANHVLPKVAAIEAGVTAATIRLARKGR